MRLAKEQRRRDAVSASKHIQPKLASPRGQVPIANSRSLEVSVSCDNSVGSSSFHSNQPTPIYSQYSADDFPHGNFNFRKENKAASAAYPQGGVGLGTNHYRHQHLEMQLSPKVKQVRRFSKKISIVVLNSILIFISYCHTYVFILTT